MSKERPHFRLLAAAVLLAAPALAGFDWNRPETVAYGVTISKCESEVTDAEGTRKLRVSAVRVDLRIPNLAFTGSGRVPGDEYGKPIPEAKTLYFKGKPVTPAEIRVRRETVSAFFDRLSAPVSEGGRGLDMVLAFNSLPTRPPYNADFADPRGLVISDGVVVSDHPRQRSPLFVVRKNGSVDIVESLVPAEYPDVLLAHSARLLIRKDGKDVVPPEKTETIGRIALGLTADRRYLYVVAVDDGATAKRGFGATNHDMNAIFADLGVADAIGLDNGPACAIVAKDRKGSRILNRFETGADPARACGSIGLYIQDRKTAAAAASAAAKGTSGAEEVSARFSQTRLNAVRERAGTPETQLKGQVRATLSSEQARFKRPMLSVVALFDVDGMWRYYDVLCSDQRVSGGICLNRGQTAAAVSKNQPEVTASAWTQPVWGDSKVGFFQGYGLDAEKAKLIAYRLELWQNGEMVASYDSDKAAAKRVGAPDDWYVKGKYDGKIAYRWPPEPPQKAIQKAIQRANQRAKRNMD